MISLIRTTSANLDFQKLVLELDYELAKKNGDANAFFAQFNKIENLQQVVICLNNNVAVGCGAIKEYNTFTIEIKRMFVTDNMRGHGIATSILKDLEEWSRTLGYKKCVLETGEQMLEAIGLYKKSGYKIIPNYAPYENVESSRCFEKIL